MSNDIWVNATLALAGTSVPTLVSNPVLTFNNREIILANGSSNALFGYAPGAARSGFSIRTMAFTANAATVINAILNTAGITIAMQLGATGGASAADCFATRVEVHGQENGEIEIQADFDNLTAPVPGGTVAVASGYGSPWHFNDVTSISMPGGTVATKLTAFAFRVLRQLATYRGNSPHGLPQDLKPAVTTCGLDGTYQKQNDVECTTAVATPKVFADCQVLLTQVDSGSPAHLSLKALQAFHNQYPQPSGNTTEYISEVAMLLAAVGGFTVA